MALKLPGVSAMPVAASVMSVYRESALGRAITSSEVSCFCRAQRACSAASGRGPDLYLEPFCVSRNKGTAINVKSLMCVLKKLHNPMKDLISLISFRGLASLMALSLFFLGLIPSRVCVKPKYKISLFLNTHFYRFISRWFFWSLARMRSSTARCFFVSVSVHQDVVN